MKRVKGKVILLITALSLILGALSLGYLGLSNYYSNRFCYGTWINGIYCTGKTVSEVNDLLVAQTEMEKFQIIDQTGEIVVIEPETIGMKIDYSGQLRALLKKQNPFLWTEKLQQNFQEFSYKPEYLFDEKLLKQAIAKTNIVIEANHKVQDVVITKGDNGYELYDGTTNNLQEDKVFTVVAEAIWKGKFAVNLAESACYKDLEYTAEMLEKLDLFAKIDEFQNPGIIYDMGDALVEIGPSIASEWISLDENGEVLLDDSGKLILRKEGIEEFIAGLAKEYDTYGSARTFQTTRGDIIMVSGGIYGNQLDQKKEIIYLTDAVLNDISETHIPKYQKEAFVRGKNDIGSTYIEIDITSQKMYYYENGELLIETDVVTGCVKEKHETPSGVNYVYDKSRNVVLRGKDYESFVKYWLPVKGGIGIHDASWRRKFGGEIYLKNGSHGCINTPTDVMKQLYNQVKVGTPVVMFY